MDGIIRCAKNSEYFMNDGSTLIDTISGVYNVSWGHSHPVVVDSIRKHSTEMLACYKLPCTGRERLSLLMSDLSGFSNWHFLSTGSEAVERAIMSAIERRIQVEGRGTSTVLTIAGGFHGKTFGTAVYHYPMLEYKRPYNVREVTEEEVMTGDITLHDFDAFLIEPVRGWDGYCYSYELLQRIGRICEDNGSYFIADEIVTSLGRAGMTGFYSLKSQECEPHILVGSKGMGQGLPISCVGLRQDAFPADFEPGVGWWSTNGSNPFVTSVAADLVQHHIDTDVTQHSLRVGNFFQNFFSQELELWNPRIIGSMIYLTTGKYTKALSKALLNERRIVATDNTPHLRMCPSFNMSESMMSYICESIDQIYKRLLSEDR